MDTSPILVQEFHSSIGQLLIGSAGDSLCLLDFKYRRMRKSIDQRLMKFLGAEMVQGSSPVISSTIEQVEAFLSGNRKVFDVQVLLCGSAFQKSVWQYLLQVPYGETRSYGQMARELGNPAGVRAVASANGANAISLVVPCHRIIGHDGSLTGYAGGLAIKKRLLRLESAQGTLFE